MFICLWKPNAEIITPRIPLTSAESVPAMKIQRKAVFDVASGPAVISANVISFGLVTALIQTGSQPAGPGRGPIVGAFEGY
jgi:hypothetical protein